MATRRKGRLRSSRPAAIALIAAVLAAVVAAIAWIGLPGPPAPAREPTADLVVMIEAAPKTLDPVMATDAYGVRIAHQLIFDTLVGLGDDLEIVPGVAESWERVTPTRLRFTLAPGQTFHNGAPLTAADVVHTLESLMAPETGSPYGPGLREKVTAVSAPNDATVEVELTAPYAAILGDLALPIRSRTPDPETPLNGSGPFRFVSESPGEIVLARNETWRGGRPGVPRVVFKVVSDENTRLLKLRKGDIDLAINAIPLDKLDQVGRPPLSEHYAIVEGPGLSYQYLGFNLEDPVLDDARVRRAIAQAIDVAALIEHRQRGHSTRSVGLLPPRSPYALQDAKPPPHDPRAAARLLDEAGYPLENGRRFGLTYKTSTDRSAVIQARAVQNDLKAIGVAVEVRPFEWGTFYDDVQKGNFQMFSLRWVGVSDPDFYYELFHSSRLPPQGRNRVRYRNPELDALLERGRVTAEPAERREIYRRVQRILLRDLPYISLWHNNNVAVVSRDLSGFRLHPTGGFQHLPAVTKAVD